MIVRLDYVSLARMVKSQARRASMTRRRMVTVVKLGPAIPDKCLLCQGELTVGGRIIICPYCGSAYHFDCLRMVAEESGMPVDSLECLMCGKRLPLREILELAGERA